MNFIFPLLIASLFAAGTYLLMSRSLLRILFGVALLGHAANLFIFAVGGIKRFAAPFVGVSAPSDPIPPALILTAIVIGVGIQALLIALLLATYGQSKSDDVEGGK